MQLHHLLGVFCTVFFSASPFDAPTCICVLQGLFPCLAEYRFANALTYLLMDTLFYIQTGVNTYGLDLLIADRGRKLFRN
mmetsp:Transcript_43697/g.76637  ORF Transcript_43697/g.76637 Transcript_43697/m.76637 type:complete len:80 (+) Transcript_43697:489-728(+)